MYKNSFVKTYIELITKNILRKTSLHNFTCFIYAIICNYARCLDTVNEWIYIATIPQNRSYRTSTNADRPAWEAPKGFNNHTAAHRCIFLSNQSINLYKLGSLYICCAHYCLHKNCPQWVCTLQWFRGGSNLVLVIMENKFFPSLSPLCIFVALSTFRRHVPAWHYGFRRHVPAWHYGFRRHVPAWHYGFSRSKYLHITLIG